MFKENIARRYCSALFGLAKDSGEVEQTKAALDAFARVLRDEPAVAEFFYSPVVDRAAKQDVLTRSLGGRLSELGLNFILLLVRKRRESLAPIVARQFEELVDAEAGRQNALIETPNALPADELASLARRLSGVYGRTLLLRQTVAPQLLGGAVIQVGDRYVDASVAGRLEDIKRQLLAPAAGSHSPAPAGARNGSPAPAVDRTR